MQLELESEVTSDLQRAISLSDNSGAPAIAYLVEPSVSKLALRLLM